MAVILLERIPFWYRLFFLYLEPISTIVGAYYAHLQQQLYLDLTDLSSSPADGVPTGTSIALSQLANLYFMFALIEALVLRSTRDHLTWQAVLLSMLVADYGHLYTVKLLGSQVYWHMTSWNAIDWGNIAFVYIGAFSRTLFLLGFGLKAQPYKYVKSI